MTARKNVNRQEAGQMSLNDYQLKEVDVRLCLKERDTLYSTHPVSDPEEAVDVMKGVLQELDREMICVVNLDNHLRPLNYNVVSIGGINLTLAPMQNIFKSAILSNAANIIVLHNHSSGSIEPSQEDQEPTKTIIMAGKLMNIPLLDHIIVGGMNGQQFSFREEYPDYFMDKLEIRLVNGRKVEQAVVADSNSDLEYGGKKAMDKQNTQNKSGVPLNYEQIRETLMIRLVNAEQYSGILMDVPHTDREDLAITYHFGIRLPDGSATSILINNEMMTDWDISLDQLHQDAIENSQVHRPVFFASMAEMLFGETMRDRPADEIPMMVMSNQSAVYGASTLFYPGSMDIAARELQGDLVILPSSVHEVILIPAASVENLQDMEYMVRSINETEVRPEDRLSDHVYYYDAQERIFERADHHEQRLQARELATAQMPGEVAAASDAKETVIVDKAASVRETTPSATITTGAKPSLLKNLESKKEQVAMQSAESSAPHHKPQKALS